MGLSVLLVDEAGRELDSVVDVHGVVDDLVRAASPGTKTLSLIDVYGDTVFNTLQAPVFLAEWDRAAPSADGDDDRLVWQAVRDLAVRVERGVHLYLKFVGD